MRLPESIGKSNASASDVLKKTENGYERHYLQLVANDDKVYGHACLNYDHTNSGGHRCYIRHLSTFDPLHLSKGLDAVVEYIWREMLCDHIRVEIYHIKDQATG